MAGNGETNEAQAKLVRLDPGATGERFVLGEITTIGRSAGNTVAVRDELVSRNHALIRREGDEFVLVDLGSANGTFVNERPISGPTTLNDDDELKVGGAVFRVQYAGGGAARGEAAPRESTRRFFAEVNIAVLVSDIRNYTVLSERVAADRLSAMLSDWFRAAGRCIEQHTGIIEKFRGDSLMAYWMASKTAGGTTHVEQALAAAQQMVDTSREFDERFREHLAGDRFKVGCGIHVGDAVLGNIGADARRDFTTLGDCVNVTFRIESLCATLDREILVSEEARRMAPSGLAFDDLGSHQLKGKAEPMQLFAL